MMTTPVLQARTPNTTHVALKIAEVRHAATQTPAPASQATQATLALFRCGGVEARAFSF